MRASINLALLLIALLNVFSYSNACGGGGGGSGGGSSSSPPYNPPSRRSPPPRRSPPARISRSKARVIGDAIATGLTAIGGRAKKAYEKVEDLAEKYTVGDTILEAGNKIVDMISGNDDKKTSKNSNKDNNNQSPKKVDSNKSKDDTKNVDQNNSGR